MDENLKNQILTALNEKMNRLSLSQNEVARRTGVSSATISNMMNHKWENITTAWLKVRNFVSEMLDTWHAANTDNFNKVQKICSHAQFVSTSRAISFEAGTGKSFAAKHYASNNKNVFYVCALGDMSKRALLKKLCRVMGIEHSYRLDDMLSDIVEELNQTNKPLVIFDEFDELDAKAMRVFKDLYNACKATGFVLIGGLHLKKKMMKGVQNNKQSMKEMFSRVGREFYALKANDNKAIQAICEANGVFDKTIIANIVSNCRGDLRGVEHEISNIKLKELVNLQKESDNVKK